MHIYHAVHVHRPCACKLVKLQEDIQSKNLKQAIRFICGPISGTQQHADAQHPSFNMLVYTASCSPFPALRESSRPRFIEPIAHTVLISMFTYITLAYLPMCTCAMLTSIINIAHTTLTYLDTQTSLGSRCHLANCSDATGHR